MPRKRTGRKLCKFSRPECTTSLDTTRSLANGPSWGEGGWRRSMYSAFPGNFSVSVSFFVYGRRVWAEFNGGENSLHWKANTRPLFSIMTLWGQHAPSIFLSIYILIKLWSSWLFVCFRPRVHSKIQGLSRPVMIVSNLDTIEFIFN